MFLSYSFAFSNLLFSGLDFKCWIGALDELLRSLRSAEDIRYSSLKIENVFFTPTQIINTTEKHFFISNLNIT